MELLDTGNHLNISSAVLPAFLAQPIMHAFSAALLLGACAFQAVVGRPDVSFQARRDAEILRRDASSFLSTEKPIALQKLLCNIGSGGCAVSGAASGAVIASPSKNDPDCKWPLGYYMLSYYVLGQASLILRNRLLHLDS